MNNKLSVFILGALLLIVFSYFLYINIFKYQIPLSASNKKLQVAASFYPVYFFAKTIGGEKTEVFNITPASAEPHDFEPAARDIARIESSDMLVLNGGNIETWGDRVRNDLQGKKITVVVAGDGLVNQQLAEQGKKIQDPHIWLDPLLAKQEVIKIEKGFEQIDPKDAVYFQQNAKDLEDKLDRLDNEFKLGLGSCQKKNFVTSHAAFGYLAARYGLNQIAISGISPDEEPSSRKLAEITDLIKKEEIKVIFFEKLVSPRLSETIAQETGAKAMVLDPIEGISNDDMRAGKNYLTIMSENLSALRTALVCTK